MLIFYKIEPITGVLFKEVNYPLNCTHSSLFLFITIVYIIYSYNWTIISNYDKHEGMYSIVTFVFDEFTSDSLLIGRWFSPGTSGFLHQQH